MEETDGIFTYTYTWNGNSTGWAFRVCKTDGTWTNVADEVGLELGVEVDAVERDNRANNAYSFAGMQRGHTYTITLNSITKKVSINEVEIEIPVYPRGVHSETELAAYDFEANPVCYLMGSVLNDNRITPEWQMAKGADGNYHIDGFTLRTMSDLKVRMYISSKNFVESAIVNNDFNDNNGYLSEGKLYNATYNVTDNQLTFEEVDSHMPFLALVGAAMKQDQDYVTPRGIESLPEGTSSNNGWQEGWLLYDENGKLLKDRAGNVMYNTMWPPKNPIYFKANIGGNRDYTSKQMTFVPQVEDGEYVKKTGAEWKALLQQGENGDAYNNLALEEGVSYYRYIVPDIWYAGPAKIWTGWGGETFNNSGNLIAQWSMHRNWGYENDFNEGTAIQPETTIGVSTEDGSNGNFAFNQPTYFKTIEFFYNAGGDEWACKNSMVYTTLAYAKAQIEAQSHQNNDAYDHGQYRPTIDLPEGVNVLNYTIRCYDASTEKLVALNDGIVAQGEGNPNNVDFVDDRDGLAEGKYYYELEVNFDNNRSTKVRSNPFIILFPGVYTLAPTGMQLVELDEAIDGHLYVTSNDNTEGAQLFYVDITNDNLTAVTAVPEEKRQSIFNVLESNTGFSWTDKVLVVAPVPAEFKLDAEKEGAIVSLESITGYTINDNDIDAQPDHSMAYLDNSNNWADKVYTAVMKYSQKATQAKPATTLMKRPEAVAGTASVTVEKVANTDEINVEGKTIAADYYTVTVELPFGAANVATGASAPQYELNLDGDKKLYAPVENANGDYAITVSHVNPDQFDGSMISVNAVYADADGNYTLPANVGDEVSLASGVAKFNAKANIGLDGFKVAWNNLLPNKAAIINLHLNADDSNNDMVGDEELDMQYYETAITYDGDEVYNNFLTGDALEIDENVIVNKSVKNSIFFDAPGVKDGKEVSIKVTPIYPVKVVSAVGATNLTETMAPQAAEGNSVASYIALRGNSATAQMSDGIVTGVNDITVDSTKAYKTVENGQVIIVRGDQRFNIVGQPIK